MVSFHISRADPVPPWILESHFHTGHLLKGLWHKKGELHLIGGVMLSIGTVNQQRGW